MEEMTKDTKAVQDAPASGTEPKKKFSPPKSKKAKKWLKILIAVVVVAAIVAGCMAGAAKKANSCCSCFSEISIRGDSSPVRIISLMYSYADWLFAICTDLVHLPLVNLMLN